MIQGDACFHIQRKHLKIEQSYMVKTVFFKLMKWKTSTYLKFIQRWQERRNQKDGEQMPKQKTRPNMVEMSQTMWTVTSRARSEGSVKKLET